MNRVIVLLLSLVCVAGIATRLTNAEPAPRSIRITEDAVTKKPAAPTSCGDNKDKHDCLHVGAKEGDCAWCKGDYMEGSCVSTFAAKFIPERVAHCKLPKKHKDSEGQGSGAAQVDSSSQEVNKKKKPAAPISCGDNKDKHDCLHIGAKEGDCAWCKGDYMPGSCVGAMAAKYIPEMVAHCKLPKKHKEGSTSVDVVPPVAGNSKKPAAPTSCGDNKDKHDCLHVGAKEGDCAWCKGDYMEGSCVSTFAAKFIPETVAKCKLPQSKVADVSSDESSSAVVSVTVDVTSANDDYPSGGGDYPSGGDSGNCKDIKKKKKCLRDSSCAWCCKSFMGEGCTDAVTVKYLPKFLADCKLGKGKVKQVIVSSNTASSSSGYGPSGSDWPSGGGAGCQDVKKKKHCLRDDSCAWCSKSFMGDGSKCVDAASVKYLPKFVADCKFGHDKKKAGVAVS